ncbi:MAG TPA: TonB-dependent receptor [Sphingobacterium sp.]|nr:TonB-dependent receptor [Sphingobacterium sp.]
MSYHLASFAQSLYSVHGIVLDKDKNPLSDVIISLNQQQSRTDKAGSFLFEQIQPGKIVINARAIGYQSYTDTITKSKDEALRLTITLFAADNLLHEVLVQGKTENQLAAEQTIRAVVVDTKENAEQPVTLAELMNRAPGIRIRQSSGLGNQVDVSINGFQGNSVQYFRDGIPLEYLGGGYGIQHVPVNQLERVEVYKGIVPSSLGGDALGGAINLVSRRQQGTTVQSSYEIGSFNTHLANLSIYHDPKNKNWFSGIDAFYNYSANNYRADVEVVDENANPTTVTVPLFHNGYKHYFAEPYFGLKGRSWADELKLALAVYNTTRESQHPALMTVPYGATYIRNKGVIPSLRYKKQIQHLSIDQFITYSQTSRNRTDTIRGTFDWYGNFRPYSDPQAVGESPRPSLADIDFNSLINRTNLGYTINEQNILEANIVYNHISRAGKDPYGLRFMGTDIDVLSKEASYTKAIAALMWESKWLKGKLSNQAMVKFFHYSTKGINGFMANATDLDQFTHHSNQNWGLGNALKYTLDDNSFLRASLELTNRLPLENELFGDNDTRAPNFELEPERSFNASLGYRYQNNRFGFEFGSYYRKTKGMILLTPVQPPFAQYQNLDSIRGYGFDVDVNYQIRKEIQVTANATWQDNRMVDIGQAVHQWIEGTRLRNSPYFFANVGIVSRFENIISTTDRLKAYMHWTFTREFYLNNIPRDAEPKGFLGLFGKANIPVTSIIPNQHLLNVGFHYDTSFSPLSLGFEIKNITDAKLYDYYKIQRPGRSIHFKINYQLSK